VELRQAFADDDDLRILWVMADNQINEKTLRFIDGLGLRERVHFAVDPHSRAIDTLHIRLADAEEIEAGVPHPTTYLLDREGVVRFVDVRRDYHMWLDPTLIREALAELP
jgi:peroxiredoxin